MEQKPLLGCVRIATTVLKGVGLILKLIHTRNAGVPYKMIYTLNIWAVDVMPSDRSLMMRLDTLGDLCSLSSSTELCRVRSTGKLTAKEADDMLKAHGLTWGDDTWVRSRGYKFVYNKNRFEKHEEKKVLH